MNVPSGDGAIVIGGDYQGLGIVRSLGRVGIPVHVVDDEHSIARFSRYTTSVFRARDLRSPEATLQTLLSLGQFDELNGCILYPTRDETVAVVAQHRSELSKYFRVPTPGWETIRWIWDKRNTHEMAGRLDIPTPRTWFFRDENTFSEIEEKLPLALKPAIKEHFVYATGDKCWRADTPGQLRQLFIEAQRHIPANEIMFQDIIPGDGAHQFAYCAFFKDRRALASMVVQRRRQHPIEFGRASTYVESVDIPEIEHLAVRFLSAVDYYGLVEVEFKLDPRNGKYCLLDVNARTWGYHTIGHSAGVDFPALLFADQTGQTFEAQRGRAGVRWIRLLTDLPTGIAGIAKGVFKPNVYVHSLCTWDEEAVFSMRDPLPGIAEVALMPYIFLARGAVVDKARRRLSRVAARITSLAPKRKPQVASANCIERPR